MNDLLAQLFALTLRLAPGAGVPDDELAQLQRFLAAALIQQDPGLLPVVPDPSMGPDINEAALAGAELADKLGAAGIRLRFVRQEYLAVDAGPERPSRVFGPFVDDDAALVQFAFFETAPFLTVSADIDLLFLDVRMTTMRLPPATAVDADDARRFTIPAGTVWLEARALSDSAGFVALRVAGGSLAFDAVPQFVPGVSIDADIGVPWTLELEPEPAPPAAAGNDADALALTLPTRFVVRSDRSWRVDGAVGLSGLGSDLAFANQSGAAVVGDDAIAFPFDVPPTTWSVASNRSAVFALAAEAVPVLGAVWQLPLFAGDISQVGEAADGGAVALLLRGDGLASRLAGTSGACTWLDTVLTATARGLELLGRRASSSIAADADLWRPAISRLRLGVPVLARLRHASRRGGADIATLAGGRAVNAWDLPRAASGRPFEFEGGIDALSLIAEPDGRRRIACAASVPQPDRQAVRGFALENLYLHVHPARRMAVAGSGPRALGVSEGTARLWFDVRLAQPILPDPYAANWRVDHLDFPLADSALGAVLRWPADAAPQLQVRLAPQAALSFPTVRAGVEDGADPLLEPFRGHLEARLTELALLDVSSADHLFGVALESLADAPPQFDADNRMAVPLRQVRLLMQPQVHWEPVDVVPNPDAGAPVREQVMSRSAGGTSLVGARAETVVPVLPGRVCEAVLRVAQGPGPAAALFALPFGLRALVHLESELFAGVPSDVTADLARPSFDAPGAVAMTGATALRMFATAGLPFPPPAGVPLPPDRGLPGRMIQGDNLALAVPPTNGLPNVLTAPIAGMVNDTFGAKVPLHRADLSGYGLSTFSRWRFDPAGDVDVAGVTEVRFEVTLGRTAYEVIEVRSRLLFAQARLVRTIVMERGNSGRVQRFDSGWNAIDDGEFRRYVPFETGAVPALRNIRRIRILDRPLVVLNGLGPEPWVFQAVEFDADAQVDGLATGGAGGLVPIHGHPGWVQVKPVRPDQKPVDGVKPADVPTQAVFEALLAAVGGGPVGGPIDCGIRLGQTLPMQLASLQVDLSRPAPGAPGSFFVAVYGAPALPRAAQWSVVRIDGRTQDVSPIDARRGVPVVRRRNEAQFRFLDPVDAIATQPTATYGLLMAGAASRVLYPRPVVVPGAGGAAGQVATGAPLVADAYALTQSSGAFPRPGFALACATDAAFAVAASGDWTSLVDDFPVSLPVPGLAGGADWGLQRTLPPNPRVKLGLDALLPVPTWSVAALQPDSLALTIPPFSSEPLFFLESAFKDAAGALPGLGKPTLRYGDPLQDLKDIVDALKQFVGLPFDVDVDVTAGDGPTPSFVVRLRLGLRIPSTPGERIDIGVGKFYGRLELLGELEAALNGRTHGGLSITFDGDVQQGILPPLLYAGGLFHFVLKVSDDGPPIVELGLGTTASIGGDLIPGLVELEVTVDYGYTLIPQTLKPGVLLGLQARAKLLGGLLGLSFGVDAMAHIQRLDLAADANTITLWCDLRVAATVQVAWFLEEERDLHTQFEQELPLGLFMLAAGANPWVALASEVI